MPNNTNNLDECKRCCSIGPLPFAFSNKTFNWLREREREIAIGRVEISKKCISSKDKHRKELLQQKILFL